MAKIVVYLGADRIISACGVTTEENVERIERGELGVKAFTDPALSAETLTAGRIDWQRLDLPPQTPRFEGLLEAAIGSVVGASGVDPKSHTTRLIVATTKGNIDLLSREPKPDPRCFIAPSVRRIAEKAGFTERPVVISNACISGVAALIVAQRMIQSGKYTDVIVAGADLLTEFVVAGFQSFKSLSSTVCRPYDDLRDGLSLGEAGGAILLTTDPRKAKGIPISLAGGALSEDANHLSAPSRTGAELAAAIDEALREASIPPQQVGFVNAHGTATRYNDEMECKALHLAGLGEKPLNSLKPYLGHTLGAAGVIETILTAEQLRRGKIFGTPGYAHCGTPLPLSVTTAHRRMPLTSAVKCASGFGGCNAAIVLRRDEVPRSPSAATPTQKVTTVGTYTLSSADGPLEECLRSEYKSLKSPNLRFARMDALSKLGYVAAEKLLHDHDLVGRYGAGRVGIILSNSSASLDTDIRHQHIVESHRAEGASPAVFVYTLPNIVIGEISIRHGIKGEGLFFIEPEADGASFAEQYARSLATTGRLDAVLCGRCEVLGEKYEVKLKLLEKYE